MTTPETRDVLAAYADFDLGHTPVTMGRAPWLTGVFLEGMHAARSARYEGQTASRARELEQMKAVSRGR